MKVSGFTFARNAVRLRYPLVESIRSVLPLVDEMVVNVGRSDDGTLDLVRGLGDPRIVVVESIWDEGSLERGRVLAEQTDIALEFDLAIRDYAAEVIRPTVQGLVDKDRFLPEVMSTSYISRNIMDRVAVKRPGYILHFASEVRTGCCSSGKGSPSRVVIFHEGWL